MIPERKINIKKLLLTITRAAIGWHFLYEGISKLFIENWTAYSYLMNTSGFLSGFYHWLASTPALMKMVDILNVYGLIIIGLALFIGLFIRVAALSGAILLMLYYFAYPPFGPSLFGAAEGHIYIVDKLFIEASVLIFLFFCKETGYSLDALRIILFKRKIKTSSDSRLETENNETGSTRREVLKNLATLPFLGVLGWGAFNMQKKYGVDAASGATIQLHSEALGELKGELPKGKLGNHEISRLILGGNLIVGYAHARDLIYVNSLFKAYNNEKKVFETLMLAENAGINTISIGFTGLHVVAKYKKMTGSKIKVIGQLGIQKGSDNLYELYEKAIDFGVDIMQVHGGTTDTLVHTGQLDTIRKLLEFIKGKGYTSGLGAHTIDALIVCEENGIIPDYYMKTMHHDNYWSAHPPENRIPYETDGKMHLEHNRYHDNLFCPFPERTVDFVNRAKIPVVGFKVLAAGAIKPDDGFRWAFENGADFICVGMFDFQIVNDVNITLDILKNLSARKRQWFA